MYDAKSEPNEFLGNDRQEAVAKACQFYGVEEADLKVVEADEIAVSGLAGRSVVVAVPRELAGRRPPGGSQGDGGHGRGGQGGGRRDGARGERRDDRRGGSRSGREDRGPRGRRESHSSDAAPEAPAVEEPAREPAREPVGEPVGESKGVANGELGEIGQFLLGTLERMKLGPFEIAEVEENGVLIYQLQGPAAQQLGQDARAAEALQLLANQAENQRSDEPSKIVVDLEGEADRREEFLERVASRAAKRATTSGRSVALEPMNGRDRRLVHIAIRDLEGVATLSIGDGRYRQVVIVPEGAPDYEEAKKSSEGASNSED